MLKYSVAPSQLSGTIHIPPSKSQSLRAILFGSLGKGASTIRNCPPLEGTLAMIEACRSFGAIIEMRGDTVYIEGIGGNIQGTENVIDAGNSGIVLRFCAALGALGSKYVVITGDHSLRHQRPMAPLLAALQELGVHAETMKEDGYAPVILKGPIRASRTHVEGADSQHVSALLIAAAFASQPMEILVSAPGEKPWVDLTLHWLNFLQIPCKNNQYESYYLQGNASYNGFDYTVPGDLSTAAFPIAAALVTNSELFITGIDLNDPQGDKEFIFILQKMGANLEIDRQRKTLRVKKGSRLKGCTIDVNNFIDAVTILAVIGCMAEGETRIMNAYVARFKECDRIRCISAELQKMGAQIQETEDGLVVRKSALYGANVHSYNDHRMALSLSVAALSAQGNSLIESVACVKKTFPTFVPDFNALGATINEAS